MKKATNLRSSYYSYSFMESYASRLFKVLEGLRVQIECFHESLLVESLLLSCYWVESGLILALALSPVTTVATALLLRFLLVRFHMHRYVK